MKSLLAISLIAIVAAGAVFGFFLIGCDTHGCGQEHMQCFAERMQAAPCPENVGAFAVANFHLGALKIFTTATLGDFSASAILLLLFLTVSGAVAVTRAAAVPPLSWAFSRARISAVRTRLDPKISHWLVLHTGRDPRTLLGCMNA